MVTVEEPAVRESTARRRPRRRRRYGSAELKSFSERDRRLFDLLVRYRRGEAVTEAIVGELMPAVRGKDRRMSAIQPLFRHADIRQELVLELLGQALTLPLRSPDYLSRRLMLAATQRLVRRMRREWHRQQDQIPLDELDKDEEEEVE